MASNKRDYYEVLGLSKGATPDEVKRSFRRLAMQYHPDRNKEPGAEQKFKEVNEAYEVLRDPEKKKIYDTYGHDGLNQQGFHSSNAQDIFNQFFGGGGVKFSFGGDDGDAFSDFFGGMFGGGRRRQAHQKTTNDQPYDIDVHYSINISFIESVLGSIHTLKYKIKSTCDQCNGTGAESKNDIKVCHTCGGKGVVITRHRTILGVMQSQEVCPTCHGSGKIIAKQCPKCHGKRFLEKEIQFDLTIQPGVTNGTTYKVENKGNM
jgi:molecular chaperone DnaJ